jgi:four helix bundle protein
MNKILVILFKNFSVMALIKNFEDMIAWKKARELNKYIYEITNKGDFYFDFALKDQIRRSAISIMGNIAEGFERNSKLQLKYHTNVAIGSSGETRSYLYLARDLNYIDDNQFNYATNSAKEISKILNNFLYKINPDH